MKKNTLYISYDGLTDPLGKAQIIPYVISIAKNSRKLIILSFEKKNKLSEINNITNLLKENNIIWINLRFSDKLKVLSKIFDTLKLFFFSIYLTIKYKIKIIHGRGTLPSFFGYLLKKLFDVKLLFDCRGMWADERKDNNHWDLNNFFYYNIFKLFKKIEKLLFINSDQVVVLSNKIIPYLVSKYNIKKKITVIPCAVDFNFFKIDENIDRSLILKNQLKINKHEFIFCYSGSLGGIYQLEKMLDFFLNINNIINETYFIFFTQNIKILKKELDKKKYINIKNNIKFLSLEREDLPKYISICDAMIYFIKPTFSKTASCPTKLGESLSLGIPVITNDGIGDIQDFFKKIQPGLLFDDINSQSFNYFIDNIEFLRGIKGHSLREKSKFFFDLKKANDLYKSVYLQLD